MAAASRDFLVTEGSEPETFAEDVRFDVEGVFGAGFEEAKEVLDDGGGGVVAVKVDEAFAVGGWGVDEGGLLGVVDEVTGVNAWWFVSFWRGDCWSNYSPMNGMQPSSTVAVSISSRRLWKFFNGWTSASSSVITSISAAGTKAHVFLRLDTSFDIRAIAIWYMVA